MRGSKITKRPEIARIILELYNQGTGIPSICKYIKESFDLKLSYMTVKSFLENNRNQQIEKEIELNVNIDDNYLQSLLEMLSVVNNQIDFIMRKVKKTGTELMALDKFLRTKLVIEKEIDKVKDKEMKIIDDLILYFIEEIVLPLVDKYVTEKERKNILQKVKQKIGVKVDEIARQYKNI